MKKLAAAVALAATLAACGGGSDTVATERTLCRDLRAGASVETIYVDADAVTQDPTSNIDHDLVLEAMANTNSVEGYGFESIEWETDKLLEDCAAIGL